MFPVWDFHLLYRKKNVASRSFWASWPQENALPGKPYISADLSERKGSGDEWIKMDWDVKMCKTQGGRRRKLGKWIRRIDHTGELGTSARRRVERSRDEWMARTSWAENSRCSVEKWKDWWMWRERNGLRKWKDESHGLTWREEIGMETGEWRNREFCAHFQFSGEFTLTIAGERRAQNHRGFDGIQRLTFNLDWIVVFLARQLLGFLIKKEKLGCKSLETELQMRQRKGRGGIYGKWVKEKSSAHTHTHTHTHSRKDSANIL